jgi:hypothetical protein
MPSRFLLVALATLLSACGAMQICPQRHAVVRQSAMSCAQLNQVTAAAVKRMGYNIDSFTTAAAEFPGKLQGTRRDDYDNTYNIAVEMHCSTAEAVADAVSTVGCAAQISFPNDFQQSFEASMAKKVQGPTMVPKEEQAGLRIEVEPLRDGDKSLGVSLAAAELMPVKVTILNRTTRVYRLDDDSVTLVSQSGAKVDALSVKEAAQRVARAKPAEGAGAEARLQDKSLRPATIAADGKLEGYLYVPRQAYRRATIRLIDDEADEPEGFTIEF